MRRKPKYLGQGEVRMATVEEKAAAFDALIKILAGKHKIVGTKRIPTDPRMTSYDFFMKNEMLCSYKDVRVYEWRLSCDGDSDIENMLLQIGARQDGR